MSVPAYASHLNEEQYLRWEKYWKYLHLSYGDNGFYFQDVKTTEDAAALITIAAMDKDVQASLEKGYPPIGFDNDGRTIETIAALLQYHPEESGQALGILTQALKDNTYDLNETDRFSLFAYTVACFNDKRFLASPESYIALADLADEVDFPSVPYSGEPVDVYRADKKIRFFAMAYGLIYLALRRDKEFGTEEERTTLKDKSIGASLRFLNSVYHFPSPDFHFFETLNDFATDQQIRSVQKEILRIYKADLQERWNYAQKNASEQGLSIKKWLEERSGSLTSYWKTINRLDGGSTQDDPPAILEKAPLPGMIGWYVRSPRLVPGGEVIPAINLSEELPEIAAVAPPQALEPYR